MSPNTINQLQPAGKIMYVSGPFFFFAVPGQRFGFLMRSLKFGTRTTIICCCQVLCEGAVTNSRYKNSLPVCKVGCCHMPRRTRGRHGQRCPIQRIHIASRIRIEARAVEQRSNCNRVARWKIREEGVLYAELFYRSIFGVSRNLSEKCWLLWTCSMSI